MTLVVVGIGSPHGDDQLGWLVIDGLPARLPAGIAMHKARGGIELLEYLAGQDLGLIIDAVAPSGHPGRIRLFTWPCPELSASSPAGTHDLGLLEALQMAEAMGQLPGCLQVLTMEAKQTMPGADPSLEVLSRLDSVIDGVCKAIQDHRS